MPTLTAIDVWKPNITPGLNALYICPQDDTFRPDNQDEGASLIDLPAEMWKNLANINNAKYSQDTEDDPIAYFDAPTSSWIEQDNTYVKKRTWELEIYNYSPIFDALMHGVANPLSEEAIAKMNAGEEMEIFRSSEPNIPVAVRLEIWNRSKQKLITRYFYANLKASGDLDFDDKILHPTVTLEVQPSVHNKQTYTTAFTGQKEVED